MWVSLLQLAFIALQYSNPQILNLVISFVELKQEMWKGYLFVIIFGLISIGIGKLRLDEDQVVTKGQTILR